MRFRLVRVGGTSCVQGEIRMNKILVNKKKLTKTKLVYLEWSDAFSERGWTHLDNLSGPDVYICSTVGWLIGENATSWIISNTLSATGATIDPLHIPKKWILKKKLLRGV